MEQKQSPESGKSLPRSKVKNKKQNQDSGVLDDECSFLGGQKDGLEKLNGLFKLGGGAVIHFDVSSSSV